MYRWSSSSKASSTFQDSVEATHFAKRLQEDIAKLQQPLISGFQSGEKWVIGICRQQDIAKATMDYPFFSKDCMNVILLLSHCLR